jgi:hypothetical protein
MRGDCHMDDLPAVVGEDDEDDRHVCDGGRRCRRMYLATMDSLAEIPSFNSSP